MVFAILHKVEAEIVDVVLVGIVVHCHLENIIIDKSLVRHLLVA